MTAYYVIGFEERSAWEGNAPTATEIAQAFAAVIRSEQARGIGLRWVAPRPRITRAFETFALNANITHATNVLAIDNESTAPQTAQAVASELDRALLAQSPDWSLPFVQAYTPAVNGALSWWACTTNDAFHCAAVTRTENAFPILAERTQPAENPIGPTSAATHPLTVAEGAARALESVPSGSSILKTVAILGVAGLTGVGLWYAWPAIVHRRGTVAKAA